uniref:Otopetrin-2 n=1 Tax=Panagrellus redivivus TaxID=6233 RepID=A0A7E4W4G8_PANRE
MFETIKNSVRIRFPSRASDHEAKPSNPDVQLSRVSTLNVDDVFDDTALSSVSYPKGRSITRSLSTFQAELPHINSKKRRFTVHSRTNYTNAWLELHDFPCDAVDMKNQTSPDRTGNASLPRPIATNANTITKQTPKENLVPNRPRISPVFDDDSMGKRSASPMETVINVYDTDLKHPETRLGMSRNSSVSSQDSEECSGVIDHSERWIDNTDAKNSVIVALTVFYALIVTIFALVLELSHLLSGEDRRAVQNKDLIFGMYMYGVSIIFLFYCYIVLLLNPRWRTTLERCKSWIQFKRFNSEANITLDGGSSIAAATIHRKVTHDSPSAGSLFLRLGSVVFGVIGTVYYAFTAFLCFIDSECSKYTVTVDVLAIVFIFTQMHFVFCNWKMTIMGHHTIARFGTMHLVAANLWTWIRYVLLEESVMDKEIRHIFTSHDDVPVNSSASEWYYDVNGEHGSGESSMEVGELLHHHSASRFVRSATKECSGADCILGSIVDIMYTSIVEYSLIGAVVMFIVWRNIDHVRQTTTAYVKRKHQIRIDCSKTTSGLFFGLAFLAATFTSMAVFYGYSLIGRNHSAAFVFSITDIIQYIIASFACIYALWQMRLLRYLHSKESPRSNVNPNQELLDMILLSLGMIGEMIYSVAGLVGLTGDKTWHPLSVVLLVCHITRLGQVGLQCCLIYIAGKLRIQGDSELRNKQPGKQVITFLLIANVAMFLMNLFETEKAGISETVVNFYGKKSWVFLVRSFSPLTIFYRFHSSVCFAEVWKNAYAWKT